MSFTSPDASRASTAELPEGFGLNDVGADTPYRKACEGLPSRRLASARGRSQITHAINLDTTLDSFDGREPGRCAVVVVSRLNPIRFDGGDNPPVAGSECRSQLFLTDGMRAGLRAIVTETQHIQGSIVPGH